MSTDWGPFVDEDDLEQTDRECPSCSSSLFVESGRFVDVYRCADCRFEGPEEPLSMAVRAIRRRVSR